MSTIMTTITATLSASSGITTIIGISTLTTTMSITMMGTTMLLWSIRMIIMITDTGFDRAYVQIGDAIEDEEGPLRAALGGMDHPK